MKKCRWGNANDKIGLYREEGKGEGGGGGCLWLGLPTEKIEDHRYKKIVFPNHKNKQLRSLFNDLFLH